MWKKKSEQKYVINGRESRYGQATAEQIQSERVAEREGNRNGLSEPNDERNALHATNS